MPPQYGTPALKGLRKKQISRVVARAGSLGMTTEMYVKYLVEEDLAISQQAKQNSFDEILGVGRSVDESEIDNLVESAKVRHHRTSRSR